MELRVGERAGGVASGAAPVLVAAALALFSARAAAASPITDPVALQQQSLLRELAGDLAAPRALVPLLELSSLEGEVRDPESLVAAYRRVASHPRAHPDVRALAGLRLA